MYERAIRDGARRLVNAGETTVAVAAALGVPQAAVWRWANRRFVSDDPSRPRTTCFACRDEACPSPEHYSYLLGQYLGDGHLVTSMKVPVLRISACLDYPDILAEIRDCVEVLRGRPTFLTRPKDCDRVAVVQSVWRHWTCLIPQHGPGRKHERPIFLALWQEDLVDEHTWPLIRGLIHSDGCRVINRVTVRGRRYEYPRYMFSNESRDILAIMGQALERVGVEWRFNRPNSISIARRGSVALMDEHIGPKT
ncbi:MAG: transcriptional regulator [Jatrophihabitans sp.]|uniref:transcriptional regulator n=1 Tax=Jatrophihabitans sp. TaxID=1932789 RepID=UPI003F7D5A18